jgi:MOSC domain-containing protein YiiM
MSGTETILLVSVNVSPGKGTRKDGTSCADVVADGISGDAHSGTPGRSVSLLDVGVIERFASEAGMEVPEHGAFGENLTVRISGNPLLSCGDTVELGDVRLLVTQVGKECHGEGCSIYRRAGRCVMPTHGIFCTVLSGGVLSPGMTGTVRRTRTGPGRASLT